MLIRPVANNDAARLAEIYSHYIRHSVVTFEEAAIDGSEMLNRLHEHRQTDLPWLVAEREGVVVGYAMASPWKGRCAYRYTVEVTVYVDIDHPRSGIGSALYADLFEQLREAQFHSVIAGIALPNDASVALHERFGLHKVAHFAEVGHKFDQWVDVGYWQGQLDA